MHTNIGTCCQSGKLRLALFKTETKKMVLPQFKKDSVGPVPERSQAQVTKMLTLSSYILNSCDEEASG